MVDRIPPQDLEALNAYLDGELSAAERSALESRLSQEPTLQAELQALQATIGILSELERVPVPRSFTLDPAVYGRKPSLLDRFGLTSTMPLVAGMAAVVVAVICVGAVLLNGGLSGGRAAPAAEVAEGDMAEEAAPAEAAFDEAVEAEMEEPAEEEAMEEAPAEEEMMAMEAPAEEESAAAEPRPDAGGGGDGPGVGSGGGPDSPGVGGDGPLPEDEFYEVTPDPNASVAEEDAVADDGEAEAPPDVVEFEGGEAAGVTEAQIVTDTPDTALTAQALTQARSESDQDETEMPEVPIEPTGPNLTPVFVVAGILLAVILLVAVVALTRRRA